MRVPWLRYSSSKAESSPRRQPSTRSGSAAETTSSPPGKLASSEKSRLSRGLLEAVQPDVAFLPSVPHALTEGPPEPLEEKAYVSGRTPPIAQPRAPAMPVRIGLTIKPPILVTTAWPKGTSLRPGALSAVG